MSNHIGIVGVSPTGASLFYKSLSAQAALLKPPHDEPRFSIHNEPLRHYIDAIHRDDWKKVGALLRRSAELLARCGARFCVCPDAVIQHAIQLAADGSPIPWLTMTELVATAAAADGRRNVGIIGTGLVMNSSTFQLPLGLRGILVTVPDEPDRKEIDRIIFEELVHGTTTAKSQAFASQIIAKLKYEKNCDAVVLASSEAPLLVNAEGSALPVYHASELLATEAIRHSISM